MSFDLGLYFYTILYSISFSLSLFFYKKYDNIKGHLFISFLGLSLITEFLAVYFIDSRIINNLIYFIYTIINFFIWFYFFKQLLSKEKSKIASVITILFIFIILLEIFYNFESLEMLKTSTVENSFYFGAFSLLFLSILYFYELLNSDKIIYNHRILYFWTTLGIVLMWIAYIPILYFIEDPVFRDKHDFFRFLIKGFNILGNICFIIGILWSQKKYNL